ncbi:MAG: O-antigen ligase C-terminal domain-containing protein [Sterolibacteriaceae bacterium]|nr:O-antigen ligase C-terminal domain-containing protein [Sterolibacteriaceae bacterium]
MVSGPFVLPFHTHPIASFHSEWWAAALGLAAACGLYTARQGLPLPVLLVVPAVLLAMLLLQFAQGQLAFAQVGLLHALYLLWAGLLMVLGRHLAATLGVAALADALALGLVVGGLAAAAAAVVQWLGIAGSVPWVFPRLGGAIQANVGQSNHHALHSFLAIASLFHLRAGTRLSRPLFWLLLTAIGFGAVLGSSRSVFLYAAVVVCAVLLARSKDAQGPGKGIVVDAALLLPWLVALSLFGSWAGAVGGDNAAATSGVRLYEEVSGPSARLAILRTGWAAFLEAPWLGQGAGNYSFASFVAASAQQAGAQFMVSEHAHNLVLNLLVEFGAPVAFAVVVALAAWAVAFLRQPWQPAHAWCAAVLGMVAIHSLLEYPLWYAYFLGPTALLLGAAGSGGGLLPGARRALVYVTIAALAGAATLAGLRADYAAIEAATYRPFAGHAERESAWRLSMQTLLRLHRESLLAPWVLRAFNIMSEPDAQLAADRADLCQLGLRLTPARALVTRCAIHHAIAGREAEARRLALSALRAFPEEDAATRGELALAARIFPAVEPLRALAESLRAVPQAGG